jgi:hypothetical protein
LRSEWWWETHPSWENSRPTSGAIETRGKGNAAENGTAERIRASDASDGPFSVSVDEMHDRATDKTRLWYSAWVLILHPELCFRCASPIPILEPEKYCLRGMNLFCRQFLRIVSIVTSPSDTLGQNGRDWLSPAGVPHCNAHLFSHFVCFALLLACCLFCLSFLGSLLLFCLVACCSCCLLFVFLGCLLFVLLVADVCAANDDCE